MNASDEGSRKVQIAKCKVCAVNPSQTNNEDDHVCSSTDRSCGKDAATESCESGKEFEMLTDKPATPQQTAAAAKTSPSGKATTIGE